MPGSQNGSSASSRATIRSQSYSSPGASSPRSAGTPTEWSSIIRTVAASLPLVANSGQYSATGASRSSRPWAARTWAHSAVAPFVQLCTTETVSRSHAVPALASAMPPHTSTTVVPSSVTHSDAPTSARSVKLRTNSSTTGANRSS